MDELIPLAKQLAINYWNTSLATENLDYEKRGCTIEPHESFASIFSETPPTECDERGFNTHGFTRNIIIIGAGASKNTGLMLASEVLKLAFDQLGIFSMLCGSREIPIDELLQYKLKDIITTKDKDKDNDEDDLTEIKNYQAEKFFSEAFHYLKSIKNYDLTLEELIKEKLSFEGSLFVLNKFVTKRDLNEFLYEKLKSKYNPNLFYEIVAYLFKHRFLDVIVNLNFDEILDNAIEDELGEGEYKRIYNDRTCIEFKEALVNGRLRKPLYIKPHGTISDLDSILYSTAQYIDNSPGLTNTLKDIFTGRTRKEEGSKNIGITKQFNVILVGYSLNDPDIVKILYPNILRNSDDLKTTLHIFDLNPKDVKINLVSEFGTKDSNAGYPIYKEYKLSDQEENDFSSLDTTFLDLFSEIQKLFRPPFIPTEPLRHLWNSRIFNKQYQKLDKGKSDMCFDRAKANLLFDFYKHNGCVPYDVIFSDRTGKYYKLYLESIEISQLGDDNHPTTLIDYLYDTFRDLKELKNCILHEDFYNSCYQSSYSNNKYDRKECWNNIEYFILQAIGKINPDLLKGNRNLKNTLGKGLNDFSDFTTKIPFGPSHELAPVYLDNKYFNFTQFEPKHIIYTNLRLTWQFYKFTVKEKDQWDELHIISNTGNAFINLDKFQSSGSGETHLAEILNKNKVNIYYWFDEPSFFEEEDAQFENPILISENYKKYENLKLYKIPEENVHHRIALFIKDNEPVKAIYFYCPPSNVRINPIWFSESEKEQNCSYTKNNLKRIKALFEISIKQ